MKSNKGYSVYGKHNRYPQKGARVPLIRLTEYLRKSSLNTPLLKGDKKEIATGDQIQPYLL